MRNKIETINACNIYKTYTHKSLFSKSKSSTLAISDVSLSVNAGEVIGIIGKNGAGKTTLIKLLSGIIRPDSGVLNVMGSDPFKRTQRYKQSVTIIIGNKSQMDEDVSIYDNALFMAAVYRIKRNVAEERIASLATKLDIANQLKQQVRTLSLGQRMKGDLLIAFLHKPTIIFLDEPTLGLDYTTQKSIRLFLKTYVHQNEASLVLTSHNIDDIKELSDYIIILNEGKTIFTGTIQELYNVVKPKKYLYFVTKEGLENKVEIKDDTNFSGIMMQMINDGCKEMNVLTTDLNEVIEELYRRNQQ